MILSHIVRFSAASVYIIYFVMNPLEFMYKIYNTHKCSLLGIRYSEAHTLSSSALPVFCCVNDTNSQTKPVRQSYVRGPCIILQMDRMVFSTKQRNIKKSRRCRRLRRRWRSVVKSKERNGEQCVYMWRKKNWSRCMCLLYNRSKSR